MPKRGLVHLSELNRRHVLLPFVGDSVGGSHRSVLELYRELVSRGVDVGFVLHQKEGPLADLLRQEGIEFIHFPITKLAGESPGLVGIGWRMLKNLIPIARFLLREKATIVHGNDLRVNLTWSLPARCIGVSYLWHQRTVLSSAPVWLAIRLLSNRFVAISKYVYDSLPRNIPEIHKRLIENPFVTDNKFDSLLAKKWLESKYSIPEYRFLIGYVGRLLPRKDVPTLLQAFRRVQVALRGGFGGVSVKPYLVIAGAADSDYAKELETMVRKLEIDRDVAFLGFSSEPERVLAGLDVAAMPSLCEAFGRTLVEAMLQETAVVASDAGGHREIVSDRYTGWLFPPGDVDKLSHMLLMLIRNRAALDAVARQGWLHATARYGITSHTDAILNIYDEITRVEQA